MRNVLRTAILLATAGTVLLCSSCSASPIAKTLFVQAVGIDQQEEQYKVAIQAFDPSQGGDGESQANVATTFIEAQGETILSGFNSMTRQVGRPPFYAQNRVVILGEQLAQNGVASVMDVFNRSKDARPMIDVFVARGQAVEAVKSTMGDSVNPAEKMQLLVEGGEDNGSMPRVQVLDVQKALLDPYTDLLLPAVRMEESQDEEQSAAVVMDSSALFQEDRLVDYLDMEETRGVLWIRGKVQDGLISFSSADLGEVTLAIQGSSSHVYVEVTENGPAFLIAVEASANIQEINVESLFHLGDDQMDRLEQEFAQAIVNQMELGLDKALRQNQCDIFSFARLLIHKDGAYWQTIQENWREVLGRAEITLSADCKIEDMGKLSNIQEQEEYH